MGVNSTTKTRGKITEFKDSSDTLVGPEIFANDNIEGEKKRSKSITPTVTEDVLATDFVSMYGKDFRHTDQWFLWNGACWARDEKDKAALSHMRTAAKARNPLGADRTLGKASTARGALAFAAADRRLSISSKGFDADPYLLGTPGGTVDLQTGKLREARRADYITQQTAVAPSDEKSYREDCAEWLDFLNVATAGDEEYQFYLQKMTGYCLTGDTQEENIIFFWGDGGNGKGTFIGAIQEVLGDYAKTVPMSFFVEKRYDMHPTTLARLHNARLITASETNEGRTWDEAMIKSITGRDKIVAHFMGRDEFEYLPKFKPLFFGNRKPKLRVVDEGISRRFVLAPFTCKPKEIDPQLKNRVKSERSLRGILRWAILGCLEWQRHGLMSPTVVLDATREYFDTQNRKAQWLDECCMIDGTAFTPTTLLWASWEKYAERYGERPNTERSFSDWLIDTAGKNLSRHRKSHGGPRGIVGIRLRDTSQDERPEHWYSK